MANKLNGLQRPLMSMKSEDIVLRLKELMPHKTFQLSRSNGVDLNIFTDTISFPSLEILEKNETFGEISINHVTVSIQFLYVLCPPI